MMDQEIVDYISQAQKHGLSDFEIKQNLVNAGWDAEVVEHSFVFSKAAENKPITARDENVFNSKSSQHQAVIQSSFVPHSTPTLTEQPAQEKTFFKKPIFWLAIIILLVLAGGAYGYYNYVYLTPARIWSSVLEAKKPAAEQIQYTFSYNGGSASSTQAVAVTLTGTAGIDSSQASNIKTAGDNSLNFQDGSLSYSLDLKYAFLGQVLYAELGNIPFIKTLTGNQNLDWVKFDIVEIQNYIKQTNTAVLKPLSGSDADNTALKTQLQDIWAKSNFIKTTGFIARENLNGVAVYHLKNNIDQEALNNAIVSSLVAVSNSKAKTASATPLTGQQEAQIRAVLNRFQEKEFEVWIGRKDSQLYKLHLVISAPSTADITSGAATSSLLPSAEQSRDANRLADVRKIQAALELYHNDFGGYPSAATGTPQNVIPYYLTAMPEAPKPADGSCTDYFNGYWYKILGKPQTVKGQVIYPGFTLTFCLGSATGGYKAGIGQLSASGISSGLACPTTADKCVSNGTQQTQDFLAAINRMDFGGQIGIDLTYSDLGKPQNIQAPPTSIDIIDLLKGSGAASSTPK